MTKILKIKQKEKTKTRTKRKYKKQKINNKKIKRNYSRTKKILRKGGGYKTLKTGEKYSSFKDENEILQECSLSDPKLLTTIMPPFDKDNEIYIWINTRCRRDFTDIMIIDPNTKKVKIKDDLLITIWGHCGFSFNPNGPIYGYSVNIDELYEKYISKDMPRKNVSEYIDEDGYLNFDSLEKFNEFKTEFEHMSLLWK